VADPENKLFKLPAADQKTTVAYAYDEIDSFDLRDSGKKPESKLKSEISREIVRAIPGPAGSIVSAGSQEIKTMESQGKKNIKVIIGSVYGKKQLNSPTPRNLRHF